MARHHKTCSPTDWLSPLTEMMGEYTLGRADDRSTAILGAYPPSGSVIPATFTGPSVPTASGVIGVYDGTNTWANYLTTDDSTIYTCPDPNSCIAADSTAQRVCFELVPAGQSPGACQAAMNPASSPITPEIAVGYVGAFTGLGDGSVLVGNYDGWTERSQCDVSGIKEIANGRMDAYKVIIRGHGGCREVPLRRTFATAATPDLAQDSPPTLPIN